MPDIETMRLGFLRAEAARLFEENEPVAYQRVKESIPLKRAYLASRPDVPSGFLEAVDRLFAFISSSEAAQRAEVRAEVLGALLYFINSSDMLPDSSKQGFQDDAVLVEDVIRRLGDRFPI